MYYHRFVNHEHKPKASGNEETTAVSTAYFYSAKNQLLIPFQCKVKERIYKNTTVKLGRNQSTEYYRKKLLKLAKYLFDTLTKKPTTTNLANCWESNSKRQLFL